MNTTIFCLLFCLVTFSWLQASDGRKIPHRYYASDDEVRSYKRVLADKLKNYLARKDPYFGGEDEESDGQPEINENDLPKNGELFEQDIVMDNSIRRAVLGLNKKRSAIELAKEGNRRHWPKGRVPYIIDTSDKSGLKAHLQERVKQAVKEFNKYTCVHYVPKKETDEDYVVFKDGKGCSSSVGRQGGEQSIHLASGCERIGTVMHEMMHALGIIHEQSRPDRDEHVKVMFDHIKEKLIPNFRKYSLDEIDKKDNVPYNFFSVMHYSNYAFSNDEHKTIVARSDHNLKFGQRVQLTSLDVLQINRLYPCHKEFDEQDLLPDMTEEDVKERKRDEERSHERYEEMF